MTVIDASGQTSQSQMLIEGTTSGLLGTYVNNWSLGGNNRLDVSAPALTRVDPVVSFNWGTGSPDATIQNDNFGIRWDGMIRPEFTEDYTFYTYTDDGARLWIDGQLVVDHWSAQSPTEWTGPPVSLQAGVWTPVSMEYFENGGGAVAELRWESASRLKQVIPTGRLAPPNAGNNGPAVVPDFATVALGGSVDIAVAANDVDESGLIDLTTVQVVGAPAYGSTSIDPVTGVVTYTQDGSFVGTDSFTYTVADFDGGVSLAGTVTLSVEIPPSTVTITSPLSDEFVVGPDVTVTYQVTGDPAGFDHLHLTLDDPPHVTIWNMTGTHTFVGVAAGPHTATAQLVFSSHNALPNPESTDQVSFTLVDPSVCGDGDVEQAEQCDDGNTADGDCCSSSCAFEASGLSCEDDGNSCTENLCDGAGSCAHPAVADGLTCDDGDPYTIDDECLVGICAGVSDVDGDGVADVDDCAPLVNSVSSPPGEVGLTLGIGPGSARVHWPHVLNGNVFNVYRGARAPATGFVYDHTPFEAESPDNESIDATVPGALETLFYLVSATNVCGEGGLGLDSSDNPRPNDTPAVPQSLDSDTDGVLDINDNCPLAANASQQDADNDGRGDPCDNCPSTSNPDQADSDEDGTGDACDS